MRSKTIFKKDKKNGIIAGLIILIMILLIPLILDSLTPSNNKEFSVSASGDNFNILDFWENEIEKVNSTPLKV